MNAHGEVKISASSPSVIHKKSRLRPRSRLWLLRQVDRSEVETRDDGWHALLDGTRSGQAKRVRGEGRHLVIGHHGDRND